MKNFKQQVWPCVLASAVIFAGASLSAIAQRSVAPETPANTATPLNNAATAVTPETAATTAIAGATAEPVERAEQPEPAEAPEAVSTERPTDGPSPDLIPAGSIQIENGAGLCSQGSQYVADLPESLVRIGVTKHWEMRMLASNLAYQTTHAPGTSRLGSQDSALSTKVLLSGPNSLLPKSAILNLSMPTGGKGLTSGSYDPTVAMIWTQTNRHGYFLNEVAQATVTTYYGARRSVWAPSVAGGRSLTARITGFAEYAPTPMPDHTVPYTVDGGLAYAGKKLQQFDVRTGYTKDAAGLHALISVGYSIRRDKLFPGVR